MSLTNHQLNLLVENDYDIGKFYIALNVQDDNLINWTTFYDEALTEAQQTVKELKDEIAEWESADQYKREAILKKINDDGDAVLQKEIDKDMKIVRGLSKVIHEVTTYASEKKLDPQHISESNLMTEILENISNKNDRMSDMKSMLRNGEMNLEKEIMEHTKALRGSLEQTEAEIVSHTKNKRMIEERMEWLCTTFEISGEEKQAIIDKYAI